MFVRRRIKIYHNTEFQSSISFPSFNINFCTILFILVHFKKKYQKKSVKIKSSVTIKTLLNCVHFSNFFLVKYEFLKISAYFHDEC